MPTCTCRRTCTPGGEWGFWAMNVEVGQLYVPWGHIHDGHDGAGASGGGGDQVAAVAQAPVAGPDRRCGHAVPVVDEALMAGGGGLGDDRVGPVVVGHHGLGHETPLGPGQPARVHEHPEPLQRPALPAVGDVLVVQERGPAAGRGGEVPDGAAGAGQVKVDQPDRQAVTEYQVGRVYVVV